MTNKTSDYLKHANDCRMLAKQAKIEEHKDMLVNMAASWEMLADWPVAALGSYEGRTS